MREAWTTWTPSCCARGWKRITIALFGTYARRLARLWIVTTVRGAWSELAWGHPVRSSFLKELCAILQTCPAGTISIYERQSSPPSAGASRSRATLTSPRLWNRCVGPVCGTESIPSAHSLSAPALAAVWYWKVESGRERLEWAVRLATSSSMNMTARRAAAEAPAALKLASPDSRRTLPMLRMSPARYLSRSTRASLRVHVWDGHSQDPATTLIAPSPAR